MKKGGYILLVSIFFALSISAAFYFIYYKPYQDEIMRTRHKIQGLKTEIAGQEKSIADIKKEIGDMDLGVVNLNYFKRNGVEGEAKIAHFLKVLNDQANRLGIRFISITPDVVEHKAEYFKESFEIEIKTDFHSLIHFLYQLQDSLGLNINRLSIMSEENNNPTETTAIIKINTLEMIDSLDQKARTLEDLRSAHIEYEPILRDVKPSPKSSTDLLNRSLSALRGEVRDPFVKPKNIQKIQEKLKQLEIELKDSKLLGIIDFEGQRHAIIGRHTVKKGDRIFNMEVLDVKSDGVVLGNGELQFIYQLEKNEKNLLNKQGEL